MPWSLPLFEFGDPARAGGFAPIDDVVMGGRSSSRAVLAGRTLVFEGTVSLEQGGGFASIRSAPIRLDLAPADALALRVRGDGQRYKLNLRTDEAFDGVTWQARFDTVAGAWQEVVLPLSGFAPVLRGRPVPQDGPLQPSRIRTLGFLIGERQAGPFRLEVAEIAAVSSGGGGVAPPHPGPR
jgi:hypothetical protein